MDRSADTTAGHHEPVMLDEVLAVLRPRSGGFYCDGTAGRGGHAQALLEASGPDGRLLAIDRDPTAVDAVRRRLEPFGGRAAVVHARFGALPQVLGEMGLGRLDGLLLDLGVSLPQLEEPSRGFSFQREGPIDMRLDPTEGETALELIERLSEEELAGVIHELGEERRARVVARTLKAALRRGDLATTTDLARAVRRAVGARRAGRIDSATRSFQALRIAVNDELGELGSVLERLPDLLADGGRAAFISFHSLEDRAVKRGLRRWSSCRCEPRVPRCRCGGARLGVVTGGKPVTAGEDEVLRNPRARSAKLRAAERLPRAPGESACQ
jgi:16S rRNA (cytosine1402-N4)-methyltransferase